MSDDANAFCNDTERLLCSCYVDRNWKNLNGIKVADERNELYSQFFQIRKESDETKHRVSPNIFD